MFEFPQSPVSFSHTKFMFVAHPSSRALPDMRETFVGSQTLDLLDPPCFTLPEFLDFELFGKTSGTQTVRLLALASAQCASNCAKERSNWAQQSVILRITF